MYSHETFGTSISPNNGFACGKSWMGVSIAMWKEDIQKGLLRKQELYDDPNFPNGWLDKVLR